MFSSYTRRRGFRALGKSALTLLLIAIVFGAGYRVGRGSWIWQHQASPATSTNLNYSSLDQVYRLLKSNYNGNLDSSALLDGAKTGLVNAAGDPYTEYFNPAAAQTFNDQLSNSISGIGAELSKNGSQIIIMSPLPGYPAAKAGLKAKDEILGVNGKVVTGMDLQAVVDLIRGPVGSKVTLTIMRGAKQFNVAIARQDISLPDTSYKIEGRIGYLQIIQFSDNTSAEAQKAAAAFKKAHVKAVILDLRDNPGGFLQGAVDISSLWLRQGNEVVQERRGSQVIDTLYASGDNPLHNLPTAVLVNSGSASASEITAAALRDNGAAFLVGTQSFGKGSVQELENLNDGSELKVTVALWYTPKGKNINHVGLKPDYVVAPGNTSDNQKTTAIKLLNAKF